jgi:hypothetical protein
VIWKRNRPASLRPVRVGPNPRPEPGLILTIFIFARRTTRAPAFCSFLMTSFMLIVASTLCQLRHASHVGVEGRRHGGTGDIITSPALFDGLRLFRGSEKFRDDREVLVEMLRYCKGERGVQPAVSLVRITQVDHGNVFPGFDRMFTICQGAARACATEARL